jgi:8-hydroxy-5-deazaflavin:NADPH oxidoreductase
MTTEKRTIAVLGAGYIGGTLGRKWHAAGHHVVFGVSNPQGQNAQSLRQALGDSVIVGSIADALASGPDVVEMAIPGPTMDETIATFAAQLDGRIVIDTANRMGEDAPNSFSQCRKHTPQALTFRAFNTLGWENFANPTFDGVTADLFYCGPDGDARAVVEQLISDIGLRPIYVGGVEQVGLIDSLTSLWFMLASQQKRGRHLAFKMLSD